MANNPIPTGIPVTPKPPVENPYNVCLPTTGYSCGNCHRCCSPEELENKKSEIGKLNL